MPNLFLQSLTDFLMFVLCNVHIRSLPMNKHQEEIALLEWEEVWFYLLSGEGLAPIMLPWKYHSGHIMELCNECNNCTKFQFYTKKPSEIHFFVVSDHFVPTLWRHKSSNLHKSKSRITWQPNVLSQCNKRQFSCHIHFKSLCTSTNHNQGTEFILGNSCRSSGVASSSRQMSSKIFVDLLGASIAFCVTLQH